MKKEHFKKNIVKYYDQEAELRNSKSVKADWKIKVRDDFLTIIKQKNKKTLLELDAGAGYDSQYFTNNGLIVTAIDISKEMVKRCKEKFIEAYELDFYELSTLNRKFDCIWAINTLLHVPKSDLDHVLNEINLVLEKDGLFYMGVYGGNDSEGEFTKSEVSNIPRFFAFHSEDFLKTILKKHFHIVKFVSFNIGGESEIDIFHSIIMERIN